MPWSDRQRAMLRAMGLRVWVRESPAPAMPPADGPMSAGAAAAGGRPAPSAPSAPFAPPAPSAAPAPPAARRDPEQRTRAPTAPPPATESGWLASSPMPSTPPAPADWLVIVEASVPADAAESDARPAQERLLLNMLRAAGVSPAAPTRSGRACVVAAPAARASTVSTAGDAGLAAWVEAVRPRLVLALGRVAAIALVGGDEPLGRLRGRVHAFHGVPVVASFGLAYLLRHPDDKARAWADLCLAVRTLEADGEGGAGGGGVSVA